MATSETNYTIWIVSSYNSEQTRTNQMHHLNYACIPTTSMISSRLFMNVAGFSEDKQLYQVPSLALKIGHSIKKCALILKGNDLESGQKYKAEQAKEFLQLCDIKWREHVSTHAHRTLYQGKCNKPNVLPTNVDVVKMSAFLQSGAREAELLQGARDPQIRPAWKRLNEVTLCHLIMFNRRRQGEVSKMKLEDFHKHTAAIVSGDLLVD